MLFNYSINTVIYSYSNILIVFPVAVVIFRRKRMNASKFAKLYDFYAIRLMFEYKQCICIRPNAIIYLFIYVNKISQVLNSRSICYHF